MNDVECHVRALKPPVDDPHVDVRARGVQRLDGLIAEAGSQTTSTERSARASRLARPRIAIALAGAAVIAAVAALSPFVDDASNPVVPAPATAQAALERAGAAAAAAEWQPLAKGEYHHTMTTSFDPTIPGVSEGPNATNRVSGADSAEVFLDRDGYGIRLYATGNGGGADAYPTPGSPDRHGQIRSFTWPFVEADEVPPPREQLRHANFVNVVKWRRSGGVPVDELWYRTPDGYKGTASPNAAGVATVKPGLTLGERLQRDQWGAPLSAIERLNDATGDELDSLLAPLLVEEDAHEIAVSGPIVGAPYEETVEWFAVQEEVQRAVKLLGSAPLAPHVRAALYQRLAGQPHARIERDAEDVLGRSGTRITFEWELDERVPSFTVTKEQLRRDAIAKHQPATGRIAGPDQVRVPEHDSVGRWYQSIIIDESSGNILQEAARSEWETSIPVPRVATTTRRAEPIDGIGWHLAIRNEPGVYVSGAGTAFVIRERTSSITNVQTAACETTPRMCR